MDHEKMVMETPAEQFNDHPRHCGHTDLMKQGMGLCIAQIKCGYNNTLATTQINGFPTCESCKFYIITKMKG